MATKIPSFTYGGQYRTEMIGDRWYIFFLTSGILKMTYGRYADVYLHGAGGGGGDSANPSGGGGGGGGWFATHTDVQIEGGKEYSIVVGTGSWNRDGEASSAFGFSAAGGKVGGDGGWSEGTGGVGGTGGSGSGGNGGGSTGGYGTSGGSNTTYAFNDSSLGLLYGGGGAGGGPKYGGDGAGGAPYGARGGKHAGDNTGAGGGGANWTDGEYTIRGRGGSGIVILRSTQDDELPVKFDGKTLRQMFFDGSEVRHLICNGTQIFMERVRRCSDWSKPKTLSLRPAR